MRKREMGLVMEMIQVLYQAHDEIKKCITGKEIADVNKQNACALLAECQNTAINMGTLIEQSEGLGFVTVNMLEDYCELVFTTSEEIVDSETINPDKIAKKLNQMLLKIENSAKHDIPVRKEVVFLPYKASMWDSLESVWEAADKDPNTDAYVIPIPYFDKNTDGSFKEMHWEGDLYPDYVPITKYEEYDFGKRHPDQIYIHNPYDEYNYVTSIHPFFYTKNLLPHTDELIYIPYFVLAEPNLDNPNLMENLGHFVNQPGVLNATRVIVQSENMKKAYVKILVELYGEQNRAGWEAKILGTGSPKFDKVAKLKKENQEIPEEWKTVLFKADGSPKKVVFYNTSVTALLENDAQMLVKMRDVFKIFEENKDKVALLWRPHPLIKATIESMRPALWADYQQLVEEYKNAGWGIYDDSTDMDRAIAISDAYYGDGSSIVQLYEKTGKPVMLQAKTVFI